MEAKFHVDPPWDRGTKIGSNGPGHMTKMAAMPIYMVKHEKFFFSVTKRLMTLTVGMQHHLHEYYSGLTLTYFMARSNFVSYAFVWEEGKTTKFSETIVVYDVNFFSSITTRPIEAKFHVDPPCDGGTKTC